MKVCMVSEMSLRSRVDDLPISIVVVRPDQEPRAVLQLAHGVCGCKERFMPLMQFMADNGVVCVAGDHRGHGDSVRDASDLGYMYEGGYMALVDDMRMITDWAHRTFPAIPIYLLGHSMGSMAARIYTKYDDSAIDGLILTGSPSWDRMSFVGRALAAFVCMIGLSHARMPWAQELTSDKYNRPFRKEGPQAWICSDPQVCKVFRDNSKCNFSLTANGSYNLMSMMAETYNKDKWVVSNADLPIIFISGADDPVMGSIDRLHRSAQNICDRGYTNVTSVLFPGMRHEVLNEIGKEYVWKEILSFVGIKAAYDR